MNILRFVCAIVLAVPPALAGAQGKTAATLRLDWVPSAHHVGPILAAQRGYYAQEGIDLTVQPGRGSSSTVQVVASGSDLFGFADAGVMAIAASKGAPVIMVANFMQVGPNGFITLERPISSPKELAGKTIGLVPGESAQPSLLAVAKKYGIPDSSYRMVSIEAASKVAALLTKKVDMITGFRFGDYLRAYTQNPDTKITLFAAWGVNVLGNGYFVTTSTLEKNPDLVQRFVRATARGWQETKKDPNAAVDALVKAFPDTNRRFIELGVPMLFEHMQSPAAKGKPLGWMAEEDWKTTLDVMKSAGLEGDRPPSAYYRNLIEH